MYRHRRQCGRRGAEHSWIFRCLLKSTTTVKLNKLKLETAAELHTAHPCFYCRGTSWTWKATQKIPQRKMQLGSGVIRVCWHLFDPLGCRQIPGVNDRQNCTTDIVNSVQQSLPKELLNKDTNPRMLPCEKGCSEKQNVGPPSQEMDSSDVRKHTHPNWMGSCCSTAWMWTFGYSWCRSKKS